MPLHKSLICKPEREAVLDWQPSTALEDAELHSRFQMAKDYRLQDMPLFTTWPLEEEFVTARVINLQHSIARFLKYDLEHCSGRACSLWPGLIAAALPLRALRNRGTCQAGSLDQFIEFSSCKENLTTGFAKVVNDFGKMKRELSRTQEEFRQMKQELQQLQQQTEQASDPAALGDSAQHFADATVRAFVDFEKSTALVGRRISVGSLTAADAATFSAAAAPLCGGTADTFAWGAEVCKARHLPRPDKWEYNSTKEMQPSDRATSFAQVMSISYGTWSKDMTDTGEDCWGTARTQGVGNCNAAVLFPNAKGELN